MKRFIPLLHCSLVLQVFVMKVSSALTQTGKLGSISKSFEPLQSLHKCATSRQKFGVVTALQSQTPLYRQISLDFQHMPGDVHPVLPGVTQAAMQCFNCLMALLGDLCASASGNVVTIGKVRCLI